MPKDSGDQSDLSREAFVQRLVAEQTGLSAYIATLLGNLHDVSNVLQQTNLVLWRKADEFGKDTNFRAWARRTAYFQTLAFLRDKKRDKHVFDEALLEQLAARPAVTDEDERRIALRHCLGHISSNSLELLLQRYSPGRSIADIAKKRGKTEGAVRTALMRIRQAVFRCIERQLIEAQDFEQSIS
jgi:RNA polymerase sigma-70 factor (ECF subfamily)